MPEWLAFSVVKDAVLFLLAVYGAALSTFNWQQAVRRERRAVKVALSTAMPAYNNGSVGRCFAKIQATNIGHRPVTITELTIELSNRGRFALFDKEGLPGVPDTRFPATLSDGESAHVYFSYRAIGEALLNNGMPAKTKITPVCEDSAGGIHRGEFWEVDPSEYAKM